MSTLRKLQDWPSFCFHRDLDFVGRLQQEGGLNAGTSLWVFRTVARVKGKDSPLVYVFLHS